MKSIKKQIIGTITLAAFALGVAGTSMAAAPPAIGQPAALSDYAVSAVKADGSEETNAVPLVAAFLAGALAAEFAHHHIVTPEPGPIEAIADESLFDL